VIDAGKAVNPVWSPTGNLIVYSSGFMNGQATLLGVRPDGASIELPFVRIRQGGYRFLWENYEDGDEIYLIGFSRGAENWLVTNPHTWLGLSLPRPTNGT
jgi:hypothetical protein